MQNLSSTLLGVCRQPSCCVQLQFVRWRKPRWIPMTKRRMLFVPSFIRPPKEQMKEKNFLDDKFKGLWKSIKTHEMAKLAQQKQLEESAETHFLYEAEIDKMIRQNEKENAEISALREQHRAVQWVKLEAEIQRIRLEKECEEEEKLKQTEEEIKQQMERLKTAIKPEDVDDAIESALNTEVDYNYAIDKNGNIYPGRHNNSVPRKPDREDEQDDKRLKIRA